MIINNLNHPITILVLALPMKEHKIFFMISHVEIAGLLETRMPALKEELCKDDVRLKVLNPLVTIRCLYNFTLKNVQRHNIAMVKKCFGIAEELYFKGNSAVKNAIENIYIYSLSNIFTACENKLYRKHIEGMVPTRLYSAYVQQILRSNI